MDNQNKSQASLLNFQFVEDLNYMSKETQNEINQDYSNQLLAVQDLRAKTSKILSKVNNNPETEQDFRRTCSLYESQISTSDSSLSQAYQEYVNAYHHVSSLYLIVVAHCKCILITYDTENEKEDLKVLETPKPLNNGTCIAHLPMGELFCFGNICSSGAALKIDSGSGIHELPSSSKKNVKFLTCKLIQKSKTN